VLNWPNRLSLSRILLSPVFMLLLIDNRQGSRTAALAVFVFASFTDLYDGYLARKYGWITNLGKFLDPLADKLLVALALIGLNQLDLIPAWALYLIIGREILVTGLRTIAAYAGVLILPSRLGKLKTATQMFSLLLYLLYSALFFEHSPVRGDFLVTRTGGVHSFAAVLLMAADVMMLAAVVLTILSGLDYLWRNKSILRRLVL
jgi:CDP-diacylglycerol--glycerol-3-phosphate 3-phosphatidyltransferase